MSDMTAADIMTRDPIAITSTATLAEATSCMVEHRINGIPVVDPQRRVVGILTGADLLHRAELATDAVQGWFVDHFETRKAAGAYVRAHARHVADIMTTDVHCAAPSDRLSAVVATMTQYNVRSLPVTEDGVLVGVISRWDLVRKLNDLLQQPEPELSDSVIRTRLEAALADEKWAPFDITAIVKDGVVSLEGCARRVEDLQALRVLAETIPGVREVRDTLFLLEPGTGWSRPADL